MRAVDTNVLVRLFAGDDPAQTRSAEAFVQQGVWVSLVVMAEMVWVLKSSYAFDSHRQADAIEMLLQNRSAILEHADAVATALDLFRARPQLGFTDCLVLECARKAGHTPLGTFDRHLARVPGVQRL